MLFHPKTIVNRKQVLIIEVTGRLLKDVFSVGDP
jgi:hypothetical protein